MNGRIVAVAHPDVLTARYPRRVGSGRTTLTVVAGTVDDLRHPATLAACIDDVDARLLADAAATGVGLLVDLASLARLLDAGTESLDTRWVPYLPVAWAPDVLAASKLLAEGAIGTPSALEITMFVGPLAAGGSASSPPIAGGWDPSAPYAATTLEAVAFGIDLAEQLAGPLPAPEWQAGDLDADIAVLVQRGGPPVTCHVRPQGSGAVPLFQATVVGSEGTLLLRAPFAPGALTLWDGRARSYRCPALARAKPNIQSPDTARGGTEVAAVLERLATGGQIDDEDALRHRAMELVRAIAANPPTAAPTRSYGC